MAFITVLKRGILGLILLIISTVPANRIDAAGGPPSQAPSCSISAMPGVDAFATSAGSYPVYAVSQGKLFRAASVGDSTWVQESAPEPGMVAVAPDPRDPHTLLYASSGGLFLSNDDGVHGTKIAASHSFTKLVRAASNPDTIYATDNTDLYRSTDDGHTWSKAYDSGQNYLNGPPELVSLVVDATAASHVLAIVNKYHSSAIIETKDGGAHWADLATAGVNDIAPTVLALNPSNGGDLWVAYGSSSLAHSQGGTLQRASAGLPASATVTAIAVDGATGAAYVAVQVAGKPNAVYVAVDARHFTRVLPEGTVGIGAFGLALITGGRTLLTFDRAQPPLAVALQTDGTATIVPFTVRGAPPPGSTVQAVPSGPATLIQVDYTGMVQARDPATGKQLWSYATLGNTFSSQVLGGTVYVAANPQAGPHCLYAIDVPTGHLRWSVAGSFFYWEIHAIAGSPVFARDSQGLSALDAATGREIWRVQTGDNRLTPVVSGGIVYTVALRPATVLAFDALTGKTVWRADLGATVQNPTFFLLVQHGILYLRAPLSGLHVFDAHTGAQLWRLPPDTPQKNYGFLGADSSQAFVIEYPSNLMGETERALDARRGTLRWSRHFAPGRVYHRWVAYRQLFVSSEPPAVGSTAPSYLYALDAQTGRQQWTIQQRVDELIALKTGLIVVFEFMPDHMSVIDATTGATRWSATPTLSLLSPSINGEFVGDNAILLQYDTGIISYDLSTGKQQWKIAGTFSFPAFETPADAAPPVIPPGAVYVATTAHSVAPPFLDAYHTLAQQVVGLPVTEAYTADGVLTQDFEHLRLEERGGRVAIAPLGSALCSLDCPAEARATVAPVASTVILRYFSQTSHTLRGDLLRFWQSHGGEAVLGLPITEVFRSTNGDGSGRSYEMQYFQNARLERHPEAADPRYAVQLGLLGDESLADRGWQ